MNRFHGHSIARLLGAALLCLAPLQPRAADLTVVGLFPNKALVQINGGPPRTLSVNQKTAEGVVLLSVEKGGATFELNGRRQTLQLGQAVGGPGSGSGGRASVTLSANPQGHFFTPGQINGAAVNFVVDTGATAISMPASDARRIGIRYLDAPAVSMSTANGVARGYRVKLDTVRVGGITVNNVDAVVMESEGMPILLGNTFLNRMEMKRDGQSMTLTKRF